jgi:hypothetical protein
MSARILPDSRYVNGAVIPASYFQALDSAQFAAINADTGGTWSPSSPITIGGAGMRASGPWSFGAAPAIEVTSGAPERITHGDSDWIQLGSGHAGASRAIYTSLGPAADTSYWTPGNAANGRPWIGYQSPSHGAKVYDSASAFVGGARLAVPLRVHNGAKLTEVDFYWKCGDAHSGGMPSSVPQIRVIRLDMFGNVAPLCQTTTTSGWMGSGWLTITSATTTGAYYSGGVAQFGIYPVDAAFELVDTSQYAYVAQVIDEAGSGAKSGNIFIAAKAACSSIPDLRPQ